MTEFTSIYDLPVTPAIYAMYGGSKRLYVAYVGEAKNLQDRIDQHFRKRNSSIVTGTFPAQLLPDYVTKVEWWAHSTFREKKFRIAAEQIAFEQLKPTLRSRSAVDLKKATGILSDENKKELEALFRGKPTGTLILLNDNFLYNRIQDLEKRLEILEKRCARALLNDQT